MNFIPREFISLLQFNTISVRKSLKVKFYSFSSTTLNDLMSLTDP